MPRLVNGARIAAGRPEGRREPPDGSAGLWITRSARAILRHEKGPRDTATGRAKTTDNLPLHEDFQIFRRLCPRRPFREPPAPLRRIHRKDGPAA